MASFHKELVLNRWMYGFFCGGSLQALKARLGDDRHEGIEDDGQTRFFHELSRNLFEVDRISADDLRRYDLNIVNHWQQITRKRNRLEETEMQMKYFQYLSLLFTEIYLDWYFNRRQELLDGLNEEITEYNAKTAIAERFQPFDADELNKLAFWNATGSGKTLLLHINILQYLQYFQRGNQNLYPDKIILLTPNEGLSRQHLAELDLSGFHFFQFFDKNKNAFRGTVEIIDINKLGDEMGDKTVAVEAFEGDNLVLVDEGHRGTGTAAGAWMSRRETLCRGGFAFEYSATFGQAVARGWVVTKSEEEALKKKAKILFETTALKKLTDEQRCQIALNSEEKRKARLLATREIYAKCILFDYSYKFFYEDGYGKESLILNLAEDNDDEIRHIYFTACLLSFYQQQYLWERHREQLAEFNIEKPLWVFVGNKVNDDDSDILTVVQFLADFLNNDAHYKAWISDLLEGKARLLDKKGRDIFERRFTPLMGLSSEMVYADILKRLFNSESRQRLKLVNLKGSKGELSLRVGENDPFGLINIGDDAAFFKLCDDATGFDNEGDEFGTSLFGTLNDKESHLHILIGSRKFTEGWSSWRVSTMGLLNMGQGEGSQIIQLFGRGVRLKGKEYSLKRSTLGQRPKGLHLDKLETLNIFGVRASYMAQFKQYLQEEGVTTSDEIIELNFETRLSPHFPKDKLKSLALKDGYKDNQRNGFKRKQFPWLYDIPAEFAGKIRTPHIELDLYPRLEALSSQDKGVGTPVITVRQTGKIASATMALFDFDRIYMGLQEYKLQRSWSNLRLDRQRLEAFCIESNGWYTLHIPASDLAIKTIADIRKQEDILIRLLQDYTDRFYKSLKNAYEGQFYEVVSVRGDDDTMLKVYHFEIEDSDDGQEYKKRLEELQKLVVSGQLGESSKWNANQMVAICFDRHLYYPLISIEGNVPLKMRPLAFDAPSEIEFVKDLEAFYTSPAGKAAIGNRSLYLLRNADSKAKGLGFAMAGNFYPDFLLWLVDDTTGQQWLSFIDPKGIRQINLTDPKFGLYQEVKVLQTKLADPNLVLNAFILSKTKFTDILNKNCTEQELEERHVLFMEHGGQAYLTQMFRKMV
ncbi:DEAD/DEAH box helicase family protein [Geotalea uraniireducens]|uniref:Helicase/UvrB N-terminal domain-containing protein n=1 Tax=Geotalea uraniireducens (strain Rf4) TaxID=351605 RepID=A5GC84_GEOUR|nr:DEAD/DEAH box helicase family protein [Geotalea uraniireducens]ABQ24806.1 hypothetical protein Gura_0594 [Geotalea uraniireducens Rf4]